MRHDIAAAVLCAAVFLAAATVGFFHQVGLFDSGETDFYAAYGPQAENILAGRPYTYRHQPPGYPLLVAAAGLFTNDLFSAGKLVSSAAAALFGGVTYSLLRALFDSRIALVATGLSVLAVFRYSFLAATDMVGAALMLLPMAMLFRRRDTARRCFVIGALSGAAFLVRYNAVFVIVGIALALLFLNLDREALGRRVAKVAVLFGGAAVVTAPWFIANWRTHGDPFLNTSHRQIAYDLYLARGKTNAEARLDEREVRDLRAEGQSFASLSDVLWHDPPRFMRAFVKNVVYEHATLLLERTLRFPSFLFVGAGFLLLLRDLGRRRLAFLGICLLGYVLLGLARFTSRYHVFLYPLLFALVVYFVFRADAVVAPAIRLLGARVIQLPTLRVSWLLVLVLLAAHATYAYRDVKSVFAEEPRYLLDIAAFLRQRSAGEDRIMIRKAHLAYLAGLNAVRPPSGGLLFDEDADLELRFVASPDGFLRRARELSVRYIAYSDYDVSHWPELAMLRNPGSVGPGFELIYKHEGTGTLIYEIDAAVRTAREMPWPAEEATFR